MTIIDPPYENLYPLKDSPQFGISKVSVSVSRNSSQHMFTHTHTHTHTHTDPNVKGLHALCNCECFGSGMSHSFSCVF